MSQWQNIKEGKKDIYLVAMLWILCRVSSCFGLAYIYCFGSIVNHIYCYCFAILLAAPISASYASTKNNWSERASYKMRFIKQFIIYLDRILTACQLCELNRDSLLMAPDQGIWSATVSLVKGMYNSLLKDLFVLIDWPQQAAAHTTFAMIRNRSPDSWLRFERFTKSLHMNWFRQGLNL